MPGWDEVCTLTQGRAELEDGVYLKTQGQGLLTNQGSKNDEHRSLMDLAAVLVVGGCWCVGLPSSSFGTSATNGAEERMRLRRRRNLASENRATVDARAIHSVHGVFVGANVCA